MTQLLQILGNNIRAIRKQHKLTQAELAEKCGLHISYIAQTERAERNLTLQTLETIALGLEVPVKNLFEINLNISSLSVETDQLIHTFSEQLKQKSEIEVKLIIELANKIFDTYK